MQTALDKRFDDDNAQVLRKHVDVVHASAAMTLKERHAANWLLLNAMRQVPDDLRGKRQHEIEVSDLCEVLFRDRDRDREQLRRVLNGLLEKRVEWQYTTESSRRSAGSSTWLAGYNIEDGVVQYSYSAEIIDKVLQPRIYARLNYSIQHLIKRSHTQSLYENCARYRDNGRTKIWSLPVFRGLMGIEDRTAYRVFKALNRSVIKPAVKEINEKSEILIEPVFLKSRGKVDRLYFNIQQNTNYSGPAIPNTVPLSQYFDTETLEERAEIYDQLLRFSVDHNAALGLMERYSDAYISENLRVVARRMRESRTKIRNVGGYVVRALESDFRDSHSTAAPQAQASMNFETEDERIDREREQVKEEAAAALDDFECRVLPIWRVEQFERELSAAELEVMRETFAEQQVAQNQFLRKFMAMPESQCYLGLWRYWVREHKLDDVTEQDRRDCAAATEFDLEGYRRQASG